MSKQLQAFPLPSKRRESDYPEVSNTALPQSGLYPAVQDTISNGTNFSDWSEEEIRLFLDRRGEDADDCPDFEALVKRAQMCEAITGPAVRPSKLQSGDDEKSSNEADPLEAFMAEINALEASSNDKCPNREARPAKKARTNGNEGLDLDEEDHVADFLEARQQRQGKMTAANITGSKTLPQQEGYDSDEEVYTAAAAAEAAEGGTGRRDVTELPTLQHEAMEYDDFEKDFYEEVPEIAALDAAAVNERRRALGIRLSGYHVPAPINSFGQCGFDETLISTIQRAGYEVPTPIQAQALPVVLSGRDVIGIAKTGSGKTAAFVLPMLVHIMDQPELSKGDGPIAVIVAPTRELAEQIHKETRRFGRAYGLRVCAAFGGLSKHQQIKELRAGSEIVVCTPGRMLDLIKAKACTTRRVTYLVLDEADRMFDMGFEPQIRSLLGQIRPDRQMVMFSATMPKKVESLVAETLTTPVRITVGIGAANEDVQQVVTVLENEAQKRRWLIDHLPGFIDEGDVIIFANQRSKVEELAAALVAEAGVAGARVGCLHGDMAQAERMQALNSFKEDRLHVLVATDVAARGLDIPSIKTVINYDVARDVDTHVHRVGRTGRAGDKEGVAYTLILPNQTTAAGQLVRCLTAAGQHVPAEVHELAMKDPKFRNSNVKTWGSHNSKASWKKGKGVKRPRAGVAAQGGLGFVETEGGQVKSGHRNIAVAGFAPSHIAADAHFAQGANESEPATIPGSKVTAPEEGRPWMSDSVRTMSALDLPRQPEATRSPKTNFISGGVTNQGNIGASPEIVKPRGAASHPQRIEALASSVSLPPPPVPVTEQPLYLQLQARMRQGQFGGQPMGISDHPTLNNAPVLQSEQAQRAIAQARAVAARLMAQRNPDEQRRS